MVEGSPARFKPKLEISPEVLTNSWLSVQFDIPNEREAIVNMSLMKAPAEKREEIIQ
ncbi:hypothetical protein MUP01_00775 [Candidatus Bathyarchaeota archaeon]|nr:hypothetical protein [Candidatus Bathyarchaeota archaeon]